jgi:Protein of unknown function (DUF1569)
MLLFSPQIRKPKMQNLFQPEATNEILSRVDKLTPTTQHQWGTMDVGQMLAHCSTTLDVASGRRLLPRMFIGRIIGPLAKPGFTNDKPFSKNGPTDKNFVITGPRDFTQEQQGLKEKIQQFHRSGESGCTKRPHSFFGPLTAQQWATGMYKHLDHHLRQFGV